MKFGVMFFASSEDAMSGEKYRLVLESAKFADRHGFSSVWVPERHFTVFGSLYPNPVVLQAALARETKRIQLCAGSVVLPLHNPIRIVEEWSMVDNLSGGRVAVSFAPGWNPNDFTFFPERYENRLQLMFDGIQTIRRLWNGRAFKGRNGIGQTVTQNVYPTPIQDRLPIWFTAAGNPRSFEMAGQLGAHLLTHLLDQSVEELAEKIVLYRQARAANGYEPDAGSVTVMLHTFVGADAETVREQARKPYCEYIKTNFGLFKGLAQSRGEGFDVNALSPEDLSQFVNYLYDRFASSRGLIGTPESCPNLVMQLSRIGVNEIACLLDFGPSVELVLENLTHLDRLRLICEEASPIETSAATRPVERGAAESVVDGDPVDLTGAHTVGQEVAIQVGEPVTPVDVDRIRERALKEISSEDFYHRLRQFGIQFDTRFQGIEHLWLGRGEVLGRVIFREELGPRSSHYQFHPAFLDACLQVFVAALFADPSLDAGLALYLPIGFERFEAYEPAGKEVWSYAVMKSVADPDAPIYEGDVQILNLEGRVSAQITNLKLRRVEAAPASTQPHLNDWLYDMTWQAKPSPSTEAWPAAASWMIFADSQGIGRELAGQLTGRGQRCLLVVPGASFAVLEEQTYQVRPALLEDMVQLFREAFRNGSPPCRGIVHLWSLDAPPADEISAATLEAAQTLSIASSMSLVRALDGLNLQEPPSLWLVTRGAQPVRSHGETFSIVQSPLWGWARTLHMEYPWLWRGLVDLDPESTNEETVDQLLAVLRWDDEEDQMALRQGERHVVRLRQNSRVEPKAQPFRWDAQGTYLITGGLGSLGLNMAQWMVNQGVRNLILAGRSAPSDAASERLALLRQTGANITAISADVADEADVSSLFDTIRRSWPSLRGIVHAAGVAGYRLIDSMTLDDLMTMFRPKILGTWFLFREARDLELDFFLSISSLSCVWGTKGLSHYAAANHFLDQFAYLGRQLGVPTVTINVGPMDGGGMASSSAEVRDLMAQVGLGLKLLPPNLTLASIDYLLGGNLAQKILADVDWSIFKNLYEKSGQGRLLELIRTESQGIAKVSEGSSRLFEELEVCPPEERLEILIAHIQRTVALVMKLRGSQLPDPEQGFFDMGMDSLMVLELKSRLQNALGYELPATLAFEHSTVEALASWLVKTLFPDGDVEEVETGEEATLERAAIAEDVVNLTDDELAATIDQELGSLIP